MNPRRLPLLSALLAVFLVAGCGTSTKTANPAAPVSSSTVGSGTTDSSSTGPGTATGTPSAAAGAGDAAPIDATCPATNTTAFAKTKFLAHAGLAFGAFHRYLYKPYQAGAYKSGQKGRIAALAKAGASALFIKREIRLMSEDAKANPTLCNAIAAPLANVGNSLSGAVSKLKNGDGTALTGAETAIAGIESKAAGTGNTITEDPNAPSS